MNARKTISAAIFFCFPLWAACGGQLYKVAPLPASRPPEISANSPIGSPTGSPTGKLTGLSIGAAVLDGDRSLEQFEANLPMAGVIAVDIRLSNLSSEKIDLSTLRFERFLRGLNAVVDDLKKITSCSLFLPTPYS